MLAAEANFQVLPVKAMHTWLERQAAPNAAAPASCAPQQDRFNTESCTFATKLAAMAETPRIRSIFPLSNSSCSKELPGADCMFSIHRVQGAFAAIAIVKVIMPRTDRAEFMESMRDRAEAPRSPIRLSLRSSTERVPLFPSASEITVHSASASLQLQSVSFVRLQERVASARAMALQPPSAIQLLDKFASVSVGLRCSRRPSAFPPALPNPLSATHRIRTEELTCIRPQQPSFEW
jgi:hypothetical protein